MMNETKIINILELLEKNHNSQSITAEMVGCSRQYVSWVQKNYGANVQAFKANRQKIKDKRNNNSTDNDKLRRTVNEYLIKNHVTKKELASRAGLSNSYLSLFLGGYSISDKKKTGLMKAIKS